MMIEHHWSNEQGMPTGGVDLRMNLADTIVAASKQGIEITFSPQWSGDQVTITASRGDKKESITVAASYFGDPSCLAVQYLVDMIGPPPENSIRNIFEDLLEEERESAGRGDSPALTC